MVKILAFLSDTCIYIRNVTLSQEHRNLFVHKGPYSSFCIWTIIAIKSKIYQCFLFCFLSCFRISHFVTNEVHVSRVVTNRNQLEIYLVYSEMFVQSGRLSRYASFKLINGNIFLFLLDQ